MKCNYLRSEEETCGAHAMNESNFCYFHNPYISAEEKRGVQSKGGKGSSKYEFSVFEPIQINGVNDVILLLENTVNAVRAGKLDVKRGNCIGILSGQLIRAFETSKIASKIEVIEQAIFQNKPA